MTRHSMLAKRLGMTAVAVAALVLGLRAADPPEFKPDGTFERVGSHRLAHGRPGAVASRERRVIGRAAPGGSGGWLVMDKEFQDLMFYANLRCEGACKTGVLLRAEKTADGGMKGLYMSLTDGGLRDLPGHD